jgi:PKD repeat protein
MPSINDWFCIDNIVINSASAFPVASFNANTASGGKPLSVTFTDTSTPAATSWSWNFGDTTGATTQNPTHSFTTVGTFGVTLTASNENGGSTSFPLVITVYEGAYPSFTRAPTIGSPPLSVTFTNTSTGSPIPNTYLLNFGDGTSYYYPHSLLTATTHIYTTGATFNATLYASNLYGCTAPATLTVDVVVQSPIDLVGVMDITGQTHPIDLIGITNITGESHPIDLISITGMSHGVPSKFRMVLR